MLSNKTPSAGLLFDLSYLGIFNLAVRTTRRKIVADKSALMTTYRALRTLGMFLSLGVFALTSCMASKPSSFENKFIGGWKRHISIGDKNVKNPVADTK